MVQHTREGSISNSDSATSSRSGRRGELTDRIRNRAREIWLAHGRPDGRADEHWLQAEHEILHEQDELEGNDVPKLDALREAAREHADSYMVKSDLEDADQREATPGVREQP
ncbi:hypothetical protein FHX08_006313 [Rhizobium sp. BK529]|uniref:DUF2934 domain-containing protein n=1 Tax=unclassified Rhizobium TaxID=2613769 RepID=UPI00161010EC|nr:MULTISPECIES: DUF2934 domain-containing protein [unclassified Rhizobium]MBB3595893.1 hypothetical protein [Rhizobium sp. BK529]MBB3660767.1 hypothetical protein [Rhizobium sp. BK650]